MTIRFACPRCGRRLVSKDKKAGDSSKCPVCGSAVTVPSKESAGQTTESRTATESVGTVESPPTPRVSPKDAIGADWLFQKSVQETEPIIKNDFGIFPSRSPREDSKQPARPAALDRLAHRHGIWISKKAVIIGSCILFALCVAAGVWAIWKVGPSGDQRSAEPGPAPPATADVIFAQASPAVVQVVIYDQQANPLGSGSGFVVSRKGLIATNFHVIDEAHTAHVVLADKKTLAVEGIAAFDQQADMAIIKVAKPVDVQPLELADDDPPPVGTRVYAIGNPHELVNTLSDGLVSGHQITPIHPIVMIQMTAAINPGSSGGPLLGPDGKVVGVTSLSRAGQSLNFAVPVSHVRRLLIRCESDGKLIRLPLIREPEALAFVEQGNAKMDKEEYDGAIKDFSEAIRLDPRNAQAYLERGFAWACKDEFDNAIKDYDMAIRLDPKNARAYMNRGAARARKREFDNAIKDYDVAIQLGWKRTDVLTVRGDAWRDKKDYDRAFHDYDEAIRLDPNNANAFYSRGYAWLYKEQFDWAKKDFDEVVRLDPKNAFGYGGQGDAWLGLGKYENAVDSYKHAILFKWSDRRVYQYKIGVAYKGAGKYEQAIRAFEEARADAVKANDSTIATQCDRLISACRMLMR
jgi:S1-C subfamily serine protease/regulator of sirC expression with transglutaminase-like and TPR domain